MSAGSEHHSKDVGVAVLQRLQSLAHGAAQAREQLDIMYPSDEAQPGIELTLEPDTAEPSMASPPAPPPTPAPAAKPAAAPAPVHQEQWVKDLNAWVARHKVTPDQQVMMDKSIFVLGLANVILTALLYLAHPRVFLLYFVFKSFVLLTSRWLVYRLKNWHYYLLEFCYVAIGMGILHCSLFPTSVLLFKTTFALYAGVLTGAVVATRNSFVLHSIDKITSLFQHMTPALVAWLLRWKTSAAVPGFSHLTAEHQAAFTQAGFVELTLYPMAVWLAWAVSYYIWVFVLADEKVRARSYATMFALQTKNPKAPIAKVVFRFKTRDLQYAAYLACHGAMCFTGCLLNNIWFHSCFMHSLLVITVLGASMWNGATYYLQILPKKAIQSSSAKAQ